MISPSLLPDPPWRDVTFSAAGAVRDAVTLLSLARPCRGAVAAGRRTVTLPQCRAAGQQRRPTVYTAGPSRARQTTRSGQRRRQCHRGGSSPGPVVCGEPSRGDIRREDGQQGQGWRPAGSSGPLWPPPSSEQRSVKVSLEIAGLHTAINCYWDGSARKFLHWSWATGRSPSRENVPIQLLS